MMWIGGSVKLDRTKPSAGAGVQGLAPGTLSCCPLSVVNVCMCMILCALYVHVRGACKGWKGEREMRAMCRHVSVV